MNKDITNDFNGANIVMQAGSSMNGKVSINNCTIIQNETTRYTMKVNIKLLHPDAVIPKYAHPGEDAGLDLTAVGFDIESGVPNGYPTLITYHTGIAVEIPNGYVGLLFPRSSVYKTGLVLSNCVGVIDSGYRGEITFKYYVTRKEIIYHQGDRVGQLIIMPYPFVEFEQKDELSDTSRGEGGYGSTGK